MAMQTMMLQELSQEAKQVVEAIDLGSNFLLSGGAGSGKTYSLVEITRHLIESRPMARIACITYTNAAVREIEQRVNHPNLRVSTIHDFLWGSIKHYQTELKSVLLDLINDSEVSQFSVLDPDGEPQKLECIPDQIRYKEYVRLREGIISHDELISVAREMFTRYEKLCRITQDCYSFILVDEYQDTSPDVIEILLSCLNRTGKPNIVGFFGDAMQSIYDEGVGSLNAYIGTGIGKVTEIQKQQNRRNPKKVIDLANALRNDGLVQMPSTDISAPNMNVDGEIKEGNLKFLYSTKNDISKAKSLLGWDFSNSKNSKELNLTHNLIATKAGFGELMRIYDGDKVLEYVKRIKAYIKDKEPETSVEEKTFGEVVCSLKQGKSAKELKAIDPTDGMLTYIGKHKAIFDLACSLPYRDLASLFIDKDHLLDDKKNSEDELSKTGSNRDDLIKHLFRIQKNVRLYMNGQFNEFLRVTDRKINSLQDKIDLKREMDGFVTLDGKTIGQIIEEANKSGIVRIDDRLLNFKTRRHYIYEQVVALPYLEFQNFCKYLEGSTPFSTQHKTKGSEFSNVFVVLNNGNWNKYNFEYLFTDRIDKESVMTRTQKIFYVCCTRAKENLAVFYESPTTEVLAKAREWFGSKNVINLDSDIET